MAITVKGNPEFGIELALMIPYAYWLHTNGLLEKVITSIGMAPFYYFCDDVEEQFTGRTIDNDAAGLREFPNIWIHGINPLVEPGVLDYSKWLCPPYKERYRNIVKSGSSRPMVFVTNKYNLEHGQTPYGYFDIKCLYDMFTILTDKGYDVIYKRASNTESDYTIDQNEYNSLLNGITDIVANVEGLGLITDKQLVEMMPNVWLFDSFKSEHRSTNEIQLQLMANCDRFISVCGGNAILSSMFGGKVITYVHKGKELRKNYFGENSYFRKLSGAEVIPVYDFITAINGSETHGHVLNTSGTNDYSGLLKTIECEF